MRVVITGHTSGLGLAFFNYFTSRGDTVIGLSRSNGYELPGNIELVAEVAASSDLFINNAYNGLSQLTLLSMLHSKTMIISSGSMAADYPKKEFLDYSVAKKALEVEHKRLKKNSPYPMLLLKMGFLENWTEYDSIPYSQIVNAVDFWLKNPRASIIEFDNVNYNNGLTK
jgi:hypothetical protein